MWNRKAIFKKVTICKFDFRNTKKVFYGLARFETCLKKDFSFTFFTNVWKDLKEDELNFSIEYRILHLHAVKLNFPSGPLVWRNISLNEHKHCKLKVSDFRSKVKSTKFNEAT